MPAELVVLDTDVWSHLYGVKGREHPDLSRWRRLLTGKTVVIAAQSRAEILAWILIRDLGVARQARILTQLDRTPTVPVDEQVIGRYARLTADARARGDALAAREHTADRWVAATALAIGAPLLTADRIYRHDPDLFLLGGAT